MKICPQCNQQNDDSMNYCTQCGLALSEIAVQSQEHNSEYNSQSETPSPIQYQQPLPPDGDHSRAIAALVLGIVGIITFYIPYFNIVSLIVSILGIIFGVQARNSIPIGNRERNLATAGFICAIVGAGLSCIGLFTCTMCLSCTLCGAYSYY